MQTADVTFKVTFVSVCDSVSNQWVKMGGEWSLVTMVMSVSMEENDL